MDKNSLDSISGQELKEMIDSKEIALEDLDNTALEKIMNFEIDMLCFGTGDMSLIRRCAMLLNERDDSDTLNEEAFISIIDKAQQEHVIIVDKENTKQTKAKVVRKKNFVLRKIGLVAAILTIMIATTTLVATAFGVNIFEYISEIVRHDEGTQKDIENFTFYHNGEAKQYSSVQEMVEKENLDIMYPTKWPEGIKLDSVRFSQGTLENMIIQFYTNDINTNIEIEINAPKTSLYECEIFVSNNIEFYIEQRDHFIAYAYIDSNKYYFTSNSKDNLITIIENLRR